MAKIKSVTGRQIWEYCEIVVSKIFFLKFWNFIFYHIFFRYNCPFVDLKKKKKNPTLLLTFYK